MNYFIDFLKHSKLLVGLLLGLFLAIILVPLFLPRKPVSMPVAVSPSPKIIFPFAERQAFPSVNRSTFGSVNIITEPEGAEVTIDKEEVEDPDFIAPINITPFTVEQIPEGKHILRIFKLGFLTKTEEIIIESDQTNEFKIKLEKNPEDGYLKEAIAKMPVSTDDYLIEYLDGIRKIQVIIRKSPYETNRQKAIEWFIQNGISDPEKAGVEFYPALNVK